MPFWNLNILPRYMPQFTSLAENVEGLTLLYTDGDPIFHPKLSYKKIELPRGINKQHIMYLLMKNLYRQVTDLDFDIIYSLSGRWLQQAACHISKKTKKPLVLRIRGDEKRVAIYQNRRLMRQLFFKDKIEESFKQASLVIPISHKLIEVAEDLGGKNITDPVPNGLDSSKFYPVPQPEEITVGCIGRLSGEKGSHFLNKLVDETLKTKYIFAGSIQCKFNAPSNVELLGAVPYSEIQEIYQKSNILLIPSKIEGYPNSLLEAYGCARPVIITPGAFPVEAELFGWKMDQNVNDWANVIYGLNHDNLGFLGEAAYEYSKFFTWERHGKTMARLIRGVMEDS